MKTCEVCEKKILPSEKYEALFDFFYHVDCLMKRPPTPVRYKDFCDRYYDENVELNCRCFINPPCDFCSDDFKAEYKEYLASLQNNHFE